jgi:hypothetical protein
VAGRRQEIGTWERITSTALRTTRRILRFAQNDRTVAVAIEALTFFLVLISTLALFCAQVLAKNATK